MEKWPIMLEDPVQRGSIQRNLADKLISEMSDHQVFEHMFRSNCYSILNILEQDVDFSLQNDELMRTVKQVCNQRQREILQKFEERHDRTTRQQNEFFGIRRQDHGENWHSFDNSRFLSTGVLCCT